MHAYIHVMGAAVSYALRIVPFHALQMSGSIDRSKSRGMSVYVCMSVQAPAAPAPASKPEAVRFTHIIIDRIINIIICMTYSL